MHFSNFPSKSDTLCWESPEDSQPFLCRALQLPVPYIVSAPFPAIREFLSATHISPVSMSLLWLEITWLDPKNMIIVAKRNEEEQDKTKSPCTDHWWQNFPTHVNSQQFFLLFIFFKKEKNQFENFLEKSSYTRILCLKELNFFSFNCPWSKRIS